ncbi:MAG: transcription-repair coupling factor [Myxococcales bacterium]|nr:transcription-repair coupling factor [Myxococcales bacterium]
MTSVRDELGAAGVEIASPMTSVRDELGAAGVESASPIAAFSVSTAQLARVVTASTRGARHVIAGAAPGSTAPFVRALAARSARAVPHIIVLVRDATAADALLDDLNFCLAAPAGPPELLSFDAAEQSPYADVASDRGAAHRRLAALFTLSRDESGDASPARPRVIVVTAAALARKWLPAARVSQRTRAIAVGDELVQIELLGTLTRIGYARAPLCEDVGTFAVRGGLVDVWGPAMRLPVRIELDGDTVASLKHFEPADQRTREELLEVFLVPAREGVLDEGGEARTRESLRDLCDAVDWPTHKTRQLIEDVCLGRNVFALDGLMPAFEDLVSLTAVLPADALVVVEEPSAVATALEVALARGREDELGKLGEPHYPSDALYADLGGIDAWLAARTSVGFNTAAIAGAAGVLGELSRTAEGSPSLAATDHAELIRAVAIGRDTPGQHAGLDPLLTRLARWHANSLTVIITARTLAQAERIALLLRHRDIEVRLFESGDTSALFASTPPTTVVTVAIGSLARGLVAAADGLVLLTEEEIFGSRVHRNKPAKTASSKRARKLLEDLRTLATGDFVVHAEHGIGRYAGLEIRAVTGKRVDFIVVEYAGGDKLYLPAYRLDRLQRFAGSDAAPKLDKLGGQSFARTKSRAKAKAREMADELLRLYAERRAAVGIATPPVDDDYRAFEAAFPYEETEDQARAIAEVSDDLEAPRPMERLVCGDVGFGKTEVALRAAFRVALSGRQVALLCPTTVLAQQHAITFAARLAGFPLTVAALSRFTSTKDEQAIVQRLRNGSLDIVIGTHRILSKDVHWKRLGLLIVDEEQRFGVSAKERIKALSTNIDVLTLTATPIPRTLQMAISGLRDLSLIATPPADRRAVRTVVMRDDPQALREIVTRELSRGGQVFFVYNRIAGLGERAAAMRELVPAARLGIAHGQMSEEPLERTMLAFVQGELDILVCTAIVESGLDIPRANTIIIDRADLLGLSQLYQLRGRVGRSTERGYCYLVVPPNNAMSDDGRARVEALQRYSDLGSGFQVASLDLDLRGGGELLGGEQTGTAQTVGLEMFCQLLEEATAELRGEPKRLDIDPELSIDVEALLPDDYIPDVGVRLSFYKRLASATDRDDVAALGAELEDRFGRPPEPARRLVQLMALKTDLRRLRALACEASAAGTTLHLRDDTPLDAHKLTQLIRQSRVPLRLSPDMRLSRRALPSERFPSGIESTERLIDDLRSVLA